MKENYDMFGNKVGEVVIDVTHKNGKLDSAFYVGALDEGIEKLTSLGYRMPTIRETAMLRMQEGAQSKVSRNPGNWTVEGIVTIPNEGVYLARQSPVLANLNKALDNYPLSLTAEQVEGALKDSVRVEEPWIKVDGLSDTPVGIFAFGDVAPGYEAFLKGDRMEYMPLFTFGNRMPAIGEKPEARQFWFRCLDIYSPIVEYADSSGKIRGIIEGK